MDRTTLKQWFSKGKKPLASHFAAWIDSFWHKDEKIPISCVENLSSELLGKMSENDTRELLSGKADNVHHHTKEDISNFEHTHQLEDIKDYTEPNIFDTIENLPPRYTWEHSDIIPESITFHLSAAGVYKYSYETNKEQFLFDLRSQSVKTESGRWGLCIDMTQILSEDRFILKVPLVRYEFAPYIDRVIFKYKYQIPNINGSVVFFEDSFPNYGDIKGDSVFYIKRNPENIYRLSGMASGECGFLEENVYCKGMLYGDAHVYVGSWGNAEKVMTGFIYSTPYFMHASQKDFGFRCDRYPTEPVFGLFPFCVLQTAYIDNENYLNMVFVKHADFENFASSFTLPLNPIIPDVTFDLILDKKGIEKKMQEENII